MILEVEIQPAGVQTAVVMLRGQLTLGTSLKVAETQIAQLVDSGTNRLVLDVRGVPYMDSAGLGTLVFLFGRAAEQGGQLRLAGATERVTSMLRMTRTDALLPSDPDVDAALAALAG